MPIQVKDVTWSETSQYIAISVPLKGASPRNLDIFSTNKYLKVSFPPYFFELALHGEVHDDGSKATVSASEVKFNLKKKVLGKWGQLHMNGQFEDKELMKHVREEAIEYRHRTDNEKLREKDTIKDQQKKLAVREQIRIDGVEKEKIKEIKNEQTEAISIDMEEWKNRNTQVEDNLHKENKENSLLFTDGLSTSSPLRNIVTNTESVTSCVETKDLDLKLERFIPAPREMGNIEVSFTPRVLATPARESKAPEEELWLSKVAEYNKMKETKHCANDVVDVEETNPMWLKDKADAFFKKGNVIAAINAYTSALMLDSKIPMIFANRAACHLSLRQFRECIQDCTCALALYEPPVPANAMARCRALVRRGTAYYELEEFIDALRDYETAVKLDPNNKGLIKDANKIRTIITR